jgi:hypothetical protein
VKFRDNSIKVLRFVQTEIISHLAQHQFFSQKRLPNKMFFVIRQQNFCRTSQGNATQECKFQDAAPSMKEVIKIYTLLFFISCSYTPV